VVLAGPRRVPWAAAAMLAVAVVYTDRVGHVPFALYQLPGVLQFFAVGAALAWLVDARPRRSPLRALGHALLGPMTVLYVAGLVLADRGVSVPWQRIQDSVVLPLAFGGVVLLGALGIRGPAGRLLESRPLVRIGRVSYGLYLVHNFAPWVLATLAGALGWPAWMHAEPWRFLLLWAISFGLAFLSWHALEQPLLRAKRRLPYARPAPDGGPSEARRSQ
jgi:peptidoglycan/LPS O-acetylase OafA/YrhL